MIIHKKHIIFAGNSKWFFAVLRQSAWIIHDQAGKSGHKPEEAAGLSCQGFRLSDGE